MSQKKGNKKVSEKLKKLFASIIIVGAFSGLQDFVRWQIKDVQRNKKEQTHHKQSWFSNLPVLIRLQRTSISHPTDIHWQFCMEMV